MEYASLKSDILSILHSSDYDFTLQLYDSEGNSTLDSEDISWIYIKDENIMIEMPTTEQPTLYFWKEIRTEDEDMIDLIKRIRELCILNGITVDVKTYDNLNRRKIYNMIKSSISKGGEMRESVNKVSKVLYELSEMVNTTKKPSDFYIDESLYSKNKKSLMESVINKINDIDILNNKAINKLLSLTMMETSYKRINKITESFFNQKPNEFNTLNENCANIQNLTKFIKQRYLENIKSEKTPHIIKVLENVIVYPIKQKLDKENLIKAYNHLLTLSEGVKTGIDMLRVIKNNKLCETYKVSKDELLDMWLSKSINEKIEPKKLIVFESVNGNKTTFDLEIVPSINLLAEHFNNSGKPNDKVSQEIINETIKLNNLTNLIENYSYNTSIKKYTKIIKELYTECVNTLKSLKSVNDKIISEAKKPYDYSKELALLEGKVGFKHPGLKYIAMYEAVQNDEKSIASTVEKIKDEKILREGLSLTLPFNKAKAVAHEIIKTNICKVKPLKENNNDKLSAVKCLFDNIYSANTDVKNAINECLFMIGTNPKKYNKDRQKFIETLKKYII